MCAPNVTAAAVKAMKSFQHEQTFTFDVPMADRRPSSQGPDEPT
jgi:hypothetical protein